MSLQVSSTVARAHRVARESESGSGAKFHRSDFFAPDLFNAKLPREERLALYGRLKDGVSSPHAFLIEQEPGADIPAHFHRVPQFQVVVEGSGRLGRNAVTPVTVHYTDPYTAYGPIVPAGEGLSYFTLRMQFDPGANYVGHPGVRELVKPSKKRFLLVGSDTVAMSSPEALAARPDVALDPFIGLQEDGVAAWVLRVPPGVSATGSDPKACGGQYFLAVNGGMMGPDGELPRLSCAYVGPEEPALEVRAGPRGLEVLVLQFPRRDTFVLQ